MRLPAETAELIDMLFGGADLRFPRNHVLDEGACGRHLANTIKQSVLSGDYCGKFFLCWLAVVKYGDDPKLKVNYSKYILEQFYFTLM